MCIINETHKIAVPLVKSLYPGKTVFNDKDFGVIALTCKQMDINKGKNDKLVQAAKLRDK